jgi:hypothetical protein
VEYRGFPRCGHKPWAESHASEPFLAALREWVGVGDPADGETADILSDPSILSAIREGRPTWRLGDT